jgi:hypothetical protein
MARTTTKASVNGNRKLPVVRNPPHHLIWKGITFMSVQPVKTTIKEIENAFAARRKLSEAIEDWKNRGEREKVELIQSFRREVVAAPLLVDRAIEKYKFLNTNVEALAANVTAAEGLLGLIDTLIKELEETQPGIVGAFKARDEEIRKAMEGAQQTS